MKRLLSFLSLLPFLAVVGCSDDTTTSPDNSPKNLDQLWPITVGNSWSYDETSPFGTTVSTFEIDTLRSMRRTDGATLLDWYVDATSFFGFMTGESGVTIGELKAGTSETAVQVVGTLPKNPVSGYISGSYRYVGVDTVTVPAGTYPNAHLFDYAVNGSHQWEYYVKGIGPVLIVGVTANGDTALRKELRSYVLK